LQPRRLTLVSCDPATLARDLRALLDAKFQIISVKLVDLFPQTFHIESVVELAAT
jgi:23S rRNA (uracil1939-C5)-methyltransferase